jgi:hypothetical protein
MTKKKYQVNIAIQDYVTVVEANSVEEAEDLAWEEMSNDELYSEFIIDKAYTADVEYLVEEND